MRNKELGQVQKEISKASLPDNADLSNDFESIILETDQRKISPFMRLFWEEQQKYLPSQNNATYHPMNSDTYVTYQTVNLFSSYKCFVCLISNYPHYIWWNRHSTFYAILVKVDILDTFFMKIENVVYRSCQNTMVLFINELVLTS